MPSAAALLLPPQEAPAPPRAADAVVAQQAALLPPPRLEPRVSRLGLALQRGHIRRRPEAYLAKARRAAVLLGLALLAPGLAALAASAAGVLGWPLAAAAGLVALGPLAAALAYAGALAVPGVRAALRARDIDAKLPYALNYLATLASAGATPQALFASLGEQPIYGAVAREARRITRDIDLLGADVVTAMARAGERTASAKWQDLLQGAITSLTSGGDLRTYFRDKAEQYLHDNRNDQKRFLEGLGVLAECFVTVVVAAPLFLIVILSVMTSLGGSLRQTVLIGYVLVLVVLPLAQAGFTVTIKAMTPEA